MAKKVVSFGLDGTEKIEVVAIRVGTYEVYKTIKTYDEWLAMDRRKGFRYVAYQIGFSQY